MRPLAWKLHTGDNPRVKIKCLLRNGDSDKCQGTLSPSWKKNPSINMLQSYIRHEWVFHICTITSAGIHGASSLCIFHHCYSLDLECSSLLPHASVSSDKPLVIQNPANMLYSLFATFSSFSKDSAHLLSFRLALSSTYSHRKVRITRHDYSLLHASFPSSSVSSLKAGASIFLSPRAEENS